jgi:DNA-binding Lrp family transcriptional regulator
LVNSGRDHVIDLDDLDRRVIVSLQEDCRAPLETLAKKLSTSKSTVHYRIKRLEAEGVIEGYYAKISPSKLRKEYAAIVLTRARPGIGLRDRLRIGKEIAGVTGVWCVYAVFGDYDFIFLVRANSRDDLAEKVNAVAIIRDIERTNSQIVEIVVKEDPRVELDSVRKTSKSKRRK